MSSLIPDPQEEDKGFIENFLDAAKEAPGNIVKAITGYASTVASGVVQAETARVSRGKAVVTPEVSKLAIGPDGKRISSTQAALEGLEGAAALPLAGMAPLAVPYREFVARPLSTAFLMANKDYRDDISVRTGDDSFFNPESWGLAWRNAQVVSPGQAIVGFVGDKVSGEQGTDKIDWTRQSEVRDYFSRGAQKYVSFGLDFMTSYKLDPYYLAGRGAGRVRRTYISRPVTTKTLPVLLKEIDEGVAGKQNGFRPTIDYIKANADNPSAIEDLDIVAKSASPSDLSKILSEAGKLAIRTNDDSYIGNVFKIGFGNNISREALAEQAPDLAQRIDKLKAQKVAIDEYLKSNKVVESITDSTFMAPLGVKGQFAFNKMKIRQHEEISQKIAEAKQETEFLDRIIADDEGSLFASIQSQTWSPFAKLELEKTKNSLKFNQAYFGVTTDKNGIRVLRWFNPSTPLRERESGIARIAGIVADRARFEARARTRTYGQTVGLTAKEQQDVYNTFAETTNKASRFKWFDDLQEKNITGIIKKRVEEVEGKPLSPEEVKLIEGVALSIAKNSASYQRQTLTRAVTTNYTIDDGFGNDVAVDLLKEYVDDIAREIAGAAKRTKPNATDYENARKKAVDLLNNVPTTETQVPALHIAMDMRLFDDIIKENASTLKLLVDEIRLHPKDYDGKSPEQVVDEILKLRIRQLTAAKDDLNLAQQTEELLSKYKDISVELLDALYSQIWKPGTLFSFKYTTRNVGEGWMRIFAVAVEYARDSRVSITETLSGAYERGVLSRAKSNAGQRAKAKEADKLFQKRYDGLNDEQKRLEKTISDLMFASTDSLTANIAEVSRYSFLVNGRYGSMLPVDKTPLTDEIIRRFSSIGQRFSDNVGIKNDESQELYDALLSGDIKTADAIIVSAREESVVFNTLEVIQKKIRAEIDALDDIVANPGFKNEPTRLQKYVNETIESYANVDESIQNIAQAALTRARSRGEIEQLIAGRTLFNDIKAAGQDEFEVIPGIKMAGYRQGVIGQIMTGEISAAQNNTRVILDSSRLVDSRYMTASTKEDIIPPTDANWAQAAADFANRHMNDRVAKKFVGDESFDDVVKWARSDAKDAKKWRAEKKFDFNSYRAQGISDPLLRIIQEINYTVTNVLPKVGNDGQIIRPLTDDSGKLILDENGNVIPGLRQLAIQGKLKAEDMFTIPERQRASVVGDTKVERTDASRLDGFVTGYKRRVDKLFNIIGTKPEDVAVRHPFYNMIYKAEGRRQAKLLQSQGLTPEQIENRISEIQVNSHKFAYKMLMERLYSIERFTDPGYTLRFLSPFYMAKQNSNRFWFGYAMRNPQAASRYFLIYQSPAKVFSVEDENGRQVETVNPFDAQDVTIKVKMPKSVAKFFGEEIPVDTFANFGISQFDLINNGYIAFLPELGGPMVDVSAGNILTAASGKAYDPELFLVNLGFDPEFLRKKVFPYYKNQEGLSKGDVLLSFALQAPSWVRSLAASDIPLVSDVTSIFNPRATDQYNRRVINVYQQKFAEWDASRDPFNPEPLTPEVRRQLLEESFAAATKMNFAEAFFGFTGPIGAPKFVTRQEELRKDLRLYQQEAIKNGGTADDGLYAFINDYGYERAGVAQFTPREINPYGFLSTPQTVRNLNKHTVPFENAYGEVGETKVAGAMLNAGDPVDDYSMVANNKLYNSKASGIGAVKSKITDPEVVKLELEINQGYKLQFAYRDYYDAAIAAGTMTKREADAGYRAAKYDIGQRYPAWKAQSGEFNPQSAQNNVKAIFEFLRNPEYVNDVVKNNKLQGAVYDFMVGRQLLVQERLNIDSNADAKIDSSKFDSVRQKRDNLVQKITAEVPEFADFFRYYLENDPLSYSGEIARLD